MSACVEIILCLLFSVTVVRVSMNHEEEFRVTGNKIRQANIQKYFTYYVKYGWLFEKRTMCFEMICARKFENFGLGLCLKRRHGMCLIVYDSKGRVNEIMDGMDGADLVVCSLMDFGI